jgi:hypothetical protein
MIRCEQRWSLTDALFLGLVVASALPVILVRYPLSADYLNHLARLHILAAQPDAPIRQFYDVHWSLIPNLAVDLLWVAVHRLASPEAVMKGALCAAIVASGLSVWFLHRSLFDRTQPTLLLCAVCLLSFPVTAGLINFALGVPLVFVALACWIRMGGQASWASLLVLNVLGVASYFAHVAILAALGLTVWIYHAFQEPFEARTILSRTAQLAPGLLLPALLAIVGALDSFQSGSIRGGEPILFNQTKLFALFAPFFTGRASTDAATLLATTSIVVLCRGPIATRLKWVLMMWTVVILAVPSSIGTAVYVDARLTIIPVMLYLSSMAFQPGPVPYSVLAAMVPALIISRILVVTPTWELHNTHVQSFRAIAGRVFPGARVMVAVVKRPPCGNNGSWELLEEHLPSLLAIDRDAFVPTVFAGEGMQPIRWKLNVRYAAVPNHVAPSLADLETTAEYAGWRDHYDYLALRDCALDRAPPPDLLFVARSDTYRLYKVVHTNTRTAARS